MCDLIETWPSRQTTLLSVWNLILVITNWPLSWISMSPKTQIVFGSALCRHYAHYPSQLSCPKLLCTGQLQDPHHCSYFVWLTIQTADHGRYTILLIVKYTGRCSYCQLEGPKVSNNDVMYHVKLQWQFRAISLHQIQYIINIECSV